ncbi:hypothetical protein [Paenibacillus xylanilyticus]|uniref:Tissue inhibitor of metalloproteinase n=1 Tax=Paenibacillus xylanilyticus TaxID=248903 RepID=A0A7Y6C0L1_9BACL|nr:hypothetical protein [Paenibacillus xylanilyticus]NUU77600.1 hypothetical protein [Paenibacillus xylanilyticus]
MKGISFVMIILFMVAIGLTVFPGEKAYACSCAYIEIPKRLEGATTAFTGKVVKRGVTPIFSQNGFREYTFEVDKAWKGVHAKKMRIMVDDSGSSSCGVQFEHNQSYLIFAYQKEKDGRLHTDLCSGNLTLSEAGETLKLLGPGKSVTEDDFQKSGGGLSVNLFRYAGGLLLAGIVLAWVWKRKKRSGFRR